MDLKIRTMSVVYEDGKNLNRVFPGNAEGSVSEKIAYFMEKELFKISDYYIDLHCGDGYEEINSICILSRCSK